ncbi:MAG: hypothetical protein O7G88_15995 [bacterium]|nr:hypothetical protein [bacterium]
MSTKTVRLDDEAEKALDQIRQATGLSISKALKRGLLMLRDHTVQEAQRAPYNIYVELDLGPGGYAIAPSTDTRRGVREAIQRKLGR